MPDISEETYARSLLDAAVQANERTRRVMLISQLVGAAVLIVAFTTFGTDWISTRREVARTAQLLLQCASKTPNTYNHLIGVERQRVFVTSSTGDRRAEELARACDGSVALSKDEALRAARFVLKRRAGTDELRAYVTLMDGLERDYGFAFPFPLLNARVDVNDFGLMAGLFHIFVLLWLNLAIRRERETTHLLARETEQLTTVDRLGPVFEPPRISRAGRALRARNFFSEVGVSLPTVGASYRTAASLGGGSLLLLFLVAIYEPDKSTLYLSVPAVVGLFSAISIWLYRRQTNVPLESAILSASTVIVPVFAFLLLACLDLLVRDSLERQYGALLSRVVVGEAILCVVNNALSGFVLERLWGMRPRA
ncbi:MAG: hypothetical protein JNJ54_33815 [Myxococcaceae bacterium]|nr:hypothetical protein [Myxococcaceae bacterium]